MKIFNVFFGKSLGGIERAYINYGRMLSDFDDLEVVNICHPKAAVREELQNFKLATHTVSNIGKWDIRSQWQLRKLIKAEKPDLVICHGNRAISFFKRAAKGLCPVVAVAHNYKLKHFKGVNHTIAITQGVKEALISQGLEPDTISVIPNAIDLANIPIKQRVSDDVPIIGSIGRFVPEKGYDTFLAALKILKEKNVQFKAVLAGDGPLRVELEKLVQNSDLHEQVTMPGWVAAPHQFYQNIDVFCLSSRQEAFGIVLLEAMTSGVPIVSTKAAGPLEILSQNNTAILADVDNPQSLADALQQALSDNNLRQQLTQNASTFVKENYSYDKVRKKFEFLFQSAHFKN